MLDRLLDTAQANAHGLIRDLDPGLEALAASAPAPVAALIRLLGTRDVRVGLGWRSIESRYLGRLADTWQMVVDDLGASDPRAGALARSVQIGASAGGEVYFGLSWTERGIHVAEIDFEEGTLAWFESVGAFFEHVAEAERSKTDRLPEAVRTILGLAQPAPAPPKPPPAVTVWTGSPPPHPFAAALAHFGVQKNAFVAGPTPKGRSLLVRRFTAGSPHTPSALVVREPDGSTRALEWPDTRDVYGLSPVPGAERALVCGGAPGPLFEVDLETGALTERRAKASWSTGFLDPAHYVVHEEQEIRVYPYPTGTAPVASAPTAGFNLFVAHERVFTLPQGKLVVHALRGDALEEQLSTELPTKLFFVNCATEHEGRRLVGSVDWDGKVTWLDVTAVT